MVETLIVQELMDLQLHPEANQAPIDTKSENFKSLREDIGDNGLQAPVKVYEDTAKNFISMTYHAEASKKPFDNEHDKELIEGIARTILANGLTDDIIVCEGKLTDGRLREAAIAKLLAEGKLDPKAIIKCRDVSLSTVKDITVSRNILRQGYSLFEKAVDVVWRYWPYFDKWTAEAEARQHGGITIAADDKNKGTVAQKFAEKAGVNDKYIYVAMELRRCDERLLDIVFRGQLNYVSAEKFNRLSKKKKAEYVQYFLTHPTANFADVSDEFKTKGAEKTKQSKGGNGDPVFECELLETSLDGNEHPVDMLRSEIDHYLDNFCVSGILTHTVCPDYMNSYAENERMFGYLTERSVFFTVDNNDDFKKDLRNLLAQYVVEVHIIDPENSADDF